MSRDTDVEQIEEALLLLVRSRAVARLHRRVGELAGAPAERSGWLLLARIAAAEPLSVSELAHRVCLDVSTISRRVQQLVESGLVARSTAERDRRACVLTLTEEGRRVRRAVVAARRSVLAEALADWSEADSEALARLLPRFAGALAEPV